MVDRNHCPDGVLAPLVNYFSNPDVSYNGVPTGDSNNDNARVIEKNMVGLRLNSAGTVAPHLPATLRKSLTAHTHSTSAITSPTRKHVSFT